MHGSAAELGDLQVSQRDAVYHRSPEIDPTWGYADVRPQECEARKRVAPPRVRISHKSRPRVAARGVDLL